MENKKKSEKSEIWKLDKAISVKLKVLSFKTKYQLFRGFGHSFQ